MPTAVGLYELDHDNFSPYQIKFIIPFRIGNSLYSTNRGCKVLLVGTTGLEPATRPL